jgi:hypothetical protein
VTPDNEALQQTRSAFGSIGAALAAERRCSAFTSRVSVPPLSPSVGPPSPVARVEVALREEPRDQSYDALLDGLTELSTSILLVVREQLRLSAIGRELLDSLLADRTHHRRTASWPGTELIGHYADVSHFKAVPRVTAVLKKHARALYDWQQPERPEDLCFLAAGGSPTLTSVAHERQACVCLRPSELAQLRSRVGQHLFGVQG